jgi:hypothetical protein
VRRWGVPHPRTSRLVVVAAGLAAVVVAAVLARPGTAADEDQVAAAREALAPAPATQLPSPAAPLPAGVLVVRPDGVDGLRLGMGTAEVVAAGFVVQEQTYDGCSRVLPGLADAGPGQGVAGWMVEDRVAAVTVDERAGEGSSFLGPGPGGRLDDLPPGDGLLRAATSVQVPWTEPPVVVDVAWLRLPGGTRVSFADLDEDRDIDHVQVLGEAADGCAEAYRAALAEQEAATPVLDLGGWGELRLGMPLQRAREIVSLQDDPVTGPGSTAEPLDGPGGGCRLLLGEDEPGLVYVVVADGVVRGIAVDSGRTDTGLRVGDPPERVRDAYPGLMTAFLLERWQQGLSADWQLPEGTLRLSPRREQVRVPSIDAVLTGPRPVVGLTQVGPGC